MILWLNGAFGVGKTTTAWAVLAAVPDARYFDPEYLGYALREFLPVPTGDFQDLPLWRHLVAEAAVGLAAEAAPGPLVTPMTMLDPGYRAEVFGAVRARGVRLRQVVLVAPEAVLRARIEADEDQGPAGWRHGRAAAAVALAARAAAEPDTVGVDASGTPEQVAAAVLAAVEQPATAE